MSSFFVCCMTQTSKVKNDDGENVNEKEEFRQWFNKIKDPFYDGCERNWLNFLQNNNSNRLTKTNGKKIISVVQCSSGFGNPNYKIKVIRYS